MHYNCTETQRPIPWTLPALLVVAALAIEGCDARPWGDGNAIPTATEVRDLSRTSSAKYLQPTPFNFVQAFVERRLRKRVDYPWSVCGFIGGDVATPAVCSSNSICLWDTEHGAVGCSATDSESLAVFTTCVDKNNNNVDSLKSNTWVFTCKGNDECYRNSYESVNGQGFTQWGCGYSDWATTVLTVPSGVDGQTAKVQLTSIYMGGIRDVPSSESSTSTSDSDSSTSSSSSSSTNSQSSTQSSSSSGSSSGSITSTNTSLSSSSSSTTSTDSTSTKSTEFPGTTIPPSPRPTVIAPPPQTTIIAGPDVGSIAGGVIGGVAGLAVIAALLFAFRKRRDDETVQIISEASRTSPGPRDMGEIYEPKELDATPRIRSELHGDSSIRLSRGRSVTGMAELPGSPVPQPIPRPPPPPPPPVAMARGYPGYPGWQMHDRESPSPAPRRI